MPESLSTTPRPTDWNEAFASLPLESPPADGWSRVDRLLAVQSPRTRLLRGARRGWRIGLGMAAALAVAILGPMQWRASHGDRASDPPHTGIATATPAPVNHAAPDRATASIETAAPDHSTVEPAPLTATALQSRASLPAHPRVDRERARRATDRLVASLAPASADSSSAGIAATPTDSDPTAPLQSQSAQLEALVALARDDRVDTALGAVLTAQLDGRIGLIDAALSQPGLSSSQRLSLWQQRVDALRELASVESTQRWLAAHGERLDGALVTVD